MRQGQETKNAIVQFSRIKQCWNAQKQYLISIRDKQMICKEVQLLQYKIKKKDPRNSIANKKQYLEALYNKDKDPLLCNKACGLSSASV